MSLLGAEKLTTLPSNMQPPSRMRLLWGVVGADIGELTIARCSRHETVAITLAVHNPSRQRAGMAPIPLVLLISCLAKIVPAIIGRVAILVIERLGPFLHQHDPDQAMSSELSGVYKDANVPVSVGQPCSLLSKPAIPHFLSVRMFEVMKRTFLPNQDAGVWGVVETLAQIFGCWQPFRHGECVT